ncbi:E3 ubiquitin-protein ligase RNF220a [Diretmus argenteus]
MDLHRAAFKMESSSYLPNPLASPALMVLASTAEASRDASIPCQQPRPFGVPVSVDKDVHLPFNNGSYTFASMYHRQGGVPPGFPNRDFPPSLLHLHHQFAPPNLDCSPISMLNHSGVGAFRPFASPPEDRDGVPGGYQSAFTPAKRLKGCLDADASPHLRYSDAEGKEYDFGGAQIPPGGSPSGALKAVEDAGKKIFAVSGLLSDRETSSSPEDRIDRCKKKMSLYDSQAPICPICQVLLRPGELQEHMETEIERLATMCLSGHPELEKLTRRHAVKILSNVGVSVEEASLAVGEVVGFDSINREAKGIEDKSGDDSDAQSQNSEAVKTKKGGKKKDKEKEKKMCNGNVDSVMDAPSQFFFGLERQNGQRKIMHSLRTENGSTIVETPEIRRYVTSFSQELYKEEYVEDIELAESFYAGLPQQFPPIMAGVRSLSSPFSFLSSLFDTVNEQLEAAVIVDAAAEVPDLGNRSSLLLSVHIKREGESPVVSPLSSEDIHHSDRYQTFLRVRANRQTRLNARIGKMKRRKPEDGGQVCPLCSAPLAGSEEEMSRHVEQCLLQREGAFGEDDSVEMDGENGRGFEEYEWAGQKRIRATALLEGGFRGTGFAMCSAKESAADSDADLDVDGDDTLEYGKAQYTEADIIPCSGAGEDQGEAREREALRGAVLNGGMPSNRITPEFSKWANDEMPSTSNGEGSKTDPNTPSSSSSSSSSSFAPRTCKNSEIERVTEDSTTTTLEALKARIRELEKQILRGDRYKCLICMDSYTMPLTSIQCWHVHCEECWLRTLGNKKLCPQCNTITSPGDLRRVYL